MSIDEARASLTRLFGLSSLSRPAAWITQGGRRAVGYTDGECRYLMGVGDTWEEAIENWRNRRDPR